jgi:general secretion pathway protein F
MEAANSLRHSLLSALAYPLIVSAVALIVVMALMAYVVPQIVSVLESQQQDLPLLTRSLMGLSSFLQVYGKALLIVVALFLISVMGSYRRFSVFRLWFDQKLLYVFLIGPMLQTAESARLASSLGTSLSGGVNLLRALRTSSLVLRNYYLQERLTLATQWVREGAELGRSMAQTGGFPPLLVQLISTGERSGELAKMLSLAAEQMTQDLRRRTLLLTSFLEPALILGMGLVVLLIVLAVMMPLIEMNTLLR